MLWMSFWKLDFSSLKGHGPNTGFYLNEAQGKTIVNRPSFANGSWRPIAITFYEFQIYPLKPGAKTFSPAELDFHPTAERIMLNFIPMYLNGGFSNGKKEF